jgi:hypothetical protein
MENKRHEEPVARLNAHPGLREQVRSLLRAVGGERDGRFARSGYGGTANP